MNIRLADKKDTIQIANIHYQEISQGFLRGLGRNFLCQLYKAMIVLSSSFVVVAEENNQIVGFIGGCFNIKLFYHDFLKKYFFKVFFILLPKIFNLSVIKKSLETLKYPKTEKTNLPVAELLTIAILPDFRGQNIAQKIFEKFVLEMERKGVKQFKVVVGEKLLPAIKFYEKVGFKFHSSISVHENDSSRVYIYTLK